MGYYLDRYRESHRSAINQRIHAVGIPILVLSLALLFFNWRWGLTLYFLGWVLQFVGHAFEGKRPPFFSHPIYLLVGPVWWLEHVLQIPPPRWLVRLASRYRQRSPAVGKQLTVD
jgi:uncharacterized membrane protein YGL010W